MNVEILMDFILKHLSNHYNSFRIYKGKARQNLHLPCFFINIKKVNFNTLIKNRASLNCTFKITFLSNESSILHKVGEELFSVLRYINNGEFKASNMYFEVFDDYVEFFADFNLYLKYEKHELEGLLNRLDERIYFKNEG